MNTLEEVIQVLDTVRTVKQQLLFYSGEARRCIRVRQVVWVGHTLLAPLHQAA